MKRFNLYLLRNRHIWPVLYGLIYIPWFFILESTYDTLDSVKYIMYCPLDDCIPFCEVFIIPYILWFLYMPLIFILLYLSSNKEFYRICAYEFLGMTVALFICTLFPNGHSLRVELPESNNIFSALVNLIYTSDTCTNVFPSIHTFGTIAAHICLIKSPQVKARPYIGPVSLVSATLICMSTVMLKQHSILDVIGGIVLAVALYFVIFKGLFRNTVITPIKHDRHQILWWLNKKKR